MSTKLGIDLNELRAALRNVKQGRIEELLEIAIDSDLFSNEFKDGSFLRSAKTELRRALRQLETDEGVPEWWSTKEVDEDGKEHRVYRQELLFTVEDYKLVIGEYVENSNRYAEVAKGLKKRCYAKFRVQIPLPFSY
jgi:hypothetical protein